MRRQAAGVASPPIFSSAAEFGWDPVSVSLCRHSTLPWYDAVAIERASSEAVQIEIVAEWGLRDRLSLLGQFAAHHAFLTFAGRSDHSFRPEEWAAIRSRGNDPRLLRLRGQESVFAESARPLELVATFSDFLSIAELDSFRQSWNRPEAVYREVFLELRRGRKGRLPWLREAAHGAVLSPGAEILTGLSSQHDGIISCVEPETLDAIGRYALVSETPLRHLRAGGNGASPLRPFSALARIGADAGGFDGLQESEVSERIVDSVRGVQVVLTIEEPYSFDPKSWQVLRMLAEYKQLAWAVPPEVAEKLFPGRRVVAAEASRWFVLASRVAELPKLQRAIERLSPPDRANWLREFVAGDDFATFVEASTLTEIPAHDIRIDIREPTRSFLSALALIGEGIPLAPASELLLALGCELTAQGLQVENVSQCDKTEFRFVDETVREMLARQISSVDRASLASLAAPILERHSMWLEAAYLHAAAGNQLKATRILEERIEWNSLPPAQTMESLRRMPLDSIRESAQLAEVLTGALINTGRYLDARSLTATLPPDRQALRRAQVERRLGDYEAGLAYLRETKENRGSFEHSLLEAELLRLQGHATAAERRLSRSIGAATTDLEKARHAYETAIVALDRGEVPNGDWISDSPQPVAYLSARFSSYVAWGEGKYPEAHRHAERALALALTVPERIDAMLDVLYASFMAGEWDSTRHHARQGIAIVAETQGDRAGAGFAFTLGYLCADSGQWEQAEQNIQRLRSFYLLNHDQPRSAETGLLAAHLALGQFRLQQAEELARAVLRGNVNKEIREAASLIVDEAIWMAGGPVPSLLSSGETQCKELQSRHKLMQGRVGRADTKRSEDGFNARLARWEQDILENRDPETPLTTSGSEALRLLRSAYGLSRRRPGSGLDKLIGSLASEFGISLPLPRAERAETKAVDGELRMLQRLASASFPFTLLEFPETTWRYVTRNRLGHWSEIGSALPLTGKELEGLESNLPSGWVRCDERSFVYIEGSQNWSEESRSAAASLFRIRSEHSNLKRVVEEDLNASETPSQIEGIIGDSAAIREVVSRVLRISRSDVPVCIEGETGTGKELIASALHRTSSRKGKAYLAVNCAALPENLIESELFGSVRGAFTGADRDRAGVIETADGGSLFLDEVGEMPIAAQAKLLRFLQEGEFRRVGEPTNRKADVRIIAATNRKLEEAVDQRTFREDLYYRLRGVDIVVPPLRERGADILLLSRHFLFRERERIRSGPDQLSAQTESVFLAYHWPGNVRELQNTIRGASALAGDVRQIDLTHLPERFRNVTGNRAAAGSYYQETERFKRKLIEVALAEAQGNQNQAAKALGMSRQSLAYQIRELGILVKK